MLRKIDNIQRNENVKNKQRIINDKYEKIKNMVSDFKWKTIKYLTDNFKTVIVGNFSTKKMTEQENMNDMVKRIGNLYSMFDFKQKLQYKCYSKNVDYKEINEGCTSKCCCKCGNYKKDLGSAKVYNCTKCKMKIDRDVNGAKNILFIGI